MKIFALAFVTLALVASTARAGEMPISTSTLGSMGLANMRQMSDSEGLAVRGKGLITFNPFANSPFAPSSAVPSPTSVLLPQIAAEFTPHFATIVTEFYGAFQGFPSLFH